MKLFFLELQPHTFSLVAIAEYFDSTTDFPHGSCWRVPHAGPPKAVAECITYIISKRTSLELE